MVVLDVSRLRSLHLIHLEQMRRSPSTLKFYGQACGRLDRFMRERGLSGVPDRAVLLDFQRHLRAEGLAPGGEHALLRGLRGVFRWAVEEGLLERDPMAKFRLPPLPKKRLPCVTPRVAEAVIRRARSNGGSSTRDAALVALLFDTGLRLGEVTRLTLDDVNFEDRSLFVRAGKGEKDRVVPFGRQLAALLALYLQAEGRITQGSEPLFASRLGNGLTRSGVVQVITKMGAAEGFTRSQVAPHAWRRGFAVQFLRNGGDLFSLQQILGHATLDMTRRYVQYLDDDLRRIHASASPLDRLA